SSTGHFLRMRGEFPSGGIGDVMVRVLGFASNGGKQVGPLSRSHEGPVMERRSFAILSLMNWAARLILSLLAMASDAVCKFRVSGSTLAVQRTTIQEAFTRTIMVTDVQNWRCPGKAP